MTSQSAQRFSDCSSKRITYSDRSTFAKVIEEIKVALLWSTLYIIYIIYNILDSLT